MPRPRLTFAAGVLLIALSWVLPCLAFLNLSAVALPPQDVSQDLRRKHAVQVTAAEHQLAIYAAIGTATAITGVAVLVYARRQWRRNANPET